MKKTIQDQTPISLSFTLRLQPNLTPPTPTLRLSLSISKLPTTTALIPMPLLSAPLLPAPLIPAPLLPGPYASAPDFSFQPSSSSDPCLRRRVTALCRASASITDLATASVISFLLHPSLRYQTLCQAELGVLYWKLNNDEELKKIREDRRYNYMDVLDLCPEKVENYEVKVKKFYPEHIHEDEEICYYLEGSGYFEVRDKDD